MLFQAMTPFFCPSISCMRRTQILYIFFHQNQHKEQTADMQLFLSLYQIVTHEVEVRVQVVQKFWIDNRTQPSQPRWVSK